MTGPAHERTLNRRWLEKELEHSPHGWGQAYVECFGWEGALDMLALQSGHVNNVNMTHRPFAGDDELKELVRDAREALNAVIARAYVVSFAAVDEYRERRHTEEDPT